jgi:hypothetical protein
VRYLLSLLAGLLLCPHAEAVSLTLGQEDIARAVAIGQRSVTSERPFDREWTVSNDNGERVVVMTPFHRLVVAGRHAAFKKEPLKPTEPEKILKEQKDRLPFWVHLKGTREDFARYYTPRLIVREGVERAIEPSFVQNERSAVPQGGGFVARCVYGFPTKELAGTSRVVLVVRDADQRDVSRFTIDLSAMR